MIGQTKTNRQITVNAEAALKEVTDMYIGMFEAMDDKCLHARRTGS